MHIRTAPGASFEGEDPSGHLVFKVSMPSDEHGYFGRQCPSCHLVFRMNVDDYDALPEDLVLTCPYCGHEEGHGEFVTEQQLNRAAKVAEDAALQMVGDMLDNAFGRLAHSTRHNKHVRVTYQSRPHFPEPLPGINEERLVRERQCSECGTRYAVFGEHRYCPVSGALPPREVADDALAAEAAKLDALAEITGAQRALLREQGVFDRLYVDTLGRVVGIVETFASGVFRARVPEAEVLLKGRGNVFQRLDDTADLFAEHLGVDLRSAQDADWSRLVTLWAARHVHTHNGGTVDERYLRAVPHTRLKCGQRVVVTERDARSAIVLAAAFFGTIGR